MSLRSSVGGRQGENEAVIASAAKQSSRFRSDVGAGFIPPSVQSLALGGGGSGGYSGCAQGGKVTQERMKIICAGRLGSRTSCVRPPSGGWCSRTRPGTAAPPCCT